MDTTHLGLQTITVKPLIFWRQLTVFTYHQKGFDMTASWVIVEKSTSKPICETYSKETIEAINKNKYQAIPILQYLQEFNRKVKNDQI